MFFLFPNLPEPAISLIKHPLDLLKNGMALVQFPLDFVIHLNAISYLLYMIDCRLDMKALFQI